MLGLFGKQIPMIDYKKKHQQHPFYVERREKIWKYYKLGDTIQSIALRFNLSEATIKREINLFINNKEER